SLHNISESTAQTLTACWNYCHEKTLHHPSQAILLSRGIEMVEILTTLSMDCDTLCAALIFPLANAKVLEAEQIEASYGTSILS
ncbi:HD domain-containing protein, partial [Rosenbergiella nectarea]|uniref:HD domain-containing protein n=2 Tax=Rosenbergiella TaxID=1356488 RepID=UPI001F4FB735